MFFFVSKNNNPFTFRFKKNAKKDNPMVKREVGLSSRRHSDTHICLLFMPILRRILKGTIKEYYDKN